MTTAFERKPSPVSNFILSTPQTQVEVKAQAQVASGTVTEAKFQVDAATQTEECTFRNGCVKHRFEYFNNVGNGLELLKKAMAGNEKTLKMLGLAAAITVENAETSAAAIFDTVFNRIHMIALEYYLSRVSKRVSACVPAPCPGAPAGAESRQAFLACVDRCMKSGLVHSLMGRIDRIVHTSQTTTERSPITSESALYCVRARAAVPLRDSDRVCHDSPATLECCKTKFIMVLTCVARNQCGGTVCCHQTFRLLEMKASGTVCSSCTVSETANGVEIVWDHVMEDFQVFSRRRSSTTSRVC